MEELKAENGNVWDKGKTKGTETFHIRRKGDKLISFAKYYWKVRIWDCNGKVSDRSEYSSFITGAFDKSDWKAI